MAEEKKKDEQAVVVNKEQELLDAINEIDAETISSASPHFTEVWKQEKLGMWLKGGTVLKYFPKLEEQALNPSKGGRPAKTSKRVISFNYVAQILGRSMPTIIKWIRLVIQVGKKREEFDAWLEEAVRPAIDSFQRKLVSADSERKEPEPDIKKAMEDKTFLAVMERVNAGEETPEDIQWLVQRVRHLTSIIRKVLQYLLDEKPDKAIASLQNIAEEK